MARVPAIRGTGQGTGKDSSIRALVAFSALSCRRLLDAATPFEAGPCTLIHKRIVKSRMSKQIIASLSGPIAALIAAVLFGASTPFAKLLLGGGLNPWLLAGLLYAGSGCGLTILFALLIRHRAEARLRYADLPWLLLVIASGGIAAPVLLMYGLAHTAASSASLLLNLEGLGTMAIAWLIFKEYVDRRLLLGAVAILMGAAVLSYQRTAPLQLGSLAIAGACLAWAIDNNLTRKLSAADPVQIAAVKGVVAAATNITLARWQGATWPAMGQVAAAATLGFFGYGVSLVLFVLALRHLGAARTSAYFSTAPFIGALVAILLLGEALSVPFLLAAVLMATGVYLHLTERHEHEHSHEAMEHEHRHSHDSHHQHAHAATDPSGEPHTHGHRHEPLTHRHPHFPDTHHRHKH
jgi:drug/metabolite transporter (DMT)-like permease